MRSNGWTLRGKNRLLELSVGGRWYVAFTLALGIAAIYSGNNVIYLLESLFLSSLLLSGTLSELTLSRVEVTRVTGNLHAGLPGEDVFVVRNLGRVPLYCLELGEWDREGRVFTAFLLHLPGGASVRVRSRQVLAERGRHRWEGLLVATSFPFGFARKIRVLQRPGTRIVWPAPEAGRRDSELGARARRGNMEIAFGEVEQVPPWQDISRVHWPLSARTGALMARPHRLTEPRQEVWLEVCRPGPELEKRIRQAAGALAKQAETLVLLERGERRRIEGAWRALDALALLPKPDPAPREAV